MDLNIEKRFQRIIEALKEKPNENIVRVWRIGRIPGLQFYYVDMEFCDFSLGDYVDSSEKYIFRLPNNFTQDFQRRCLDILTQITNGLAFLHSLDVMHLNLKPSNGLFLIVTINND